MDVTKTMLYTTDYYPWPNDKETLNVYFWSPHPKIDAEALVYRLDFNTFISAVGGGLGLFLGFSVFSVFLYTFDLVEKRCCR